MPDGILERIEEDLEALEDRVLASLLVVNSKLDKLLAAGPAPAPTPTDPLAWPYKLVKELTIPHPLPQYLRGGLAVAPDSTVYIALWSGETYFGNNNLVWTIEKAFWPLAATNPANPYCNGLAWWENDLWVATRFHYDSTPPATTTIYSRGGKTKFFPLPRQRYSGFVKAKDTLYLGCGGYESGQGSACGPSMAKMDGTGLILIEAQDFTAPWELRTPREPNYTLLDPPYDSWVAMRPRIENGKSIGRWCADCIYGGGLALPCGITFWPWMGTGPLSYKPFNPGEEQRVTFSQNPKTYRYVYDPVSYKLLGWREWDGARVVGQDVDATGKVYLLEDAVGGMKLRVFEPL